MDDYLKCLNSRCLDHISTSVLDQFISSARKHHLHVVPA